jgi:D-alanyl-D-alanine carboxypeptidase/D-alanyl-D-alanine-endopeptidase (penicillin-binding protein 4)
MTRRRLPVVIVLALLLAGPAGAGGSPLANRLAKALAVPHVSQARTAAIAFDLETGETLFADHGALSLAPASNEKLVVTYAALVGLGTGYKIETDVLGRGQQNGTVWHGHLLLVGHGDPTLSSADLAQLAAQVRAAGITRVTGAVFGDETFFDTRRTAPGWKSWYYVNESAPLSALTVDRAGYRGRISRNPALSAALLFRDALRRAGVAVGGAGLGEAHGDEVPLAAVDSPPLSEIVRYMDRHSDNFTAEMVAKAIGAYAGGSGTTARGMHVAGEVAAPMLGEDASLVHLADGSGLSHANRTTAGALARLLAGAAANPAIAKPLAGALSVMGANGTLAHRLPELRGRVLGKSGTLDNVSALAGYVTGRSGRRFSFAVLMNVPALSDWDAHATQDAIVRLLAKR